MRNKYKGICYKCGGVVEVGQGYFQRSKGEWLTKHATGTKEEAARCVPKEDEKLN